MKTTVAWVLRRLSDAQIAELVGLVYELIGLIQHEDVRRALKRRYPTEDWPPEPGSSAHG